jgi:hypothetical protein
MGISVLIEASRRELPFRGRRLIALALALGSLTSSGYVSAAEASPSATSAAGVKLEQARRLLLERAKERYEAGRAGGPGAREQLEGALDALRLAYQLAPASWLLFNLAQVKSQLGACSEAAELYQRFLASHPAPDARANAEGALKLLGGCEGSAPEPPMDEDLGPGLREPSSAALLAAVPPALLSAGSAAPAVEADSFRGWPWIFGGLALTSAVVGALFYADAVDAKHDLDGLRVGGPRVVETQQRGETAQTASRVLGGFALGFTLAAGASLWPTAEPEAPSEGSQSLGQLRGLPLGASYSFEF